MLWGRVTYEMMESYWPAVARGDVEAPPAIREWAVKLEAKPKDVVSFDANGFSLEPQPPHCRRPAHRRTEAQGRDPGWLAAGQRQARDRTGQAGSDRRIQFACATPDRRPRPDAVRKRAARHATARTDLGDAAALWRSRHALPARVSHSVGRMKPCAAPTPSRDQTVGEEIANGDQPRPRARAGDRFAADPDLQRGARPAGRRHRRCLPVRGARPSCCTLCPRSTTRCRWAAPSS